MPVIQLQIWTLTNIEHEIVLVDDEICRIAAHVDHREGDDDDDDDGESDSEDEVVGAEAGAAPDGGSDVEHEGDEESSSR